MLVQLEIGRVSENKLAATQPVGPEKVYRLLPFLLEPLPVYVSDHIVTATVLGLAAEIERDFIVLRTRAALVKRTTERKPLGCPQGQPAVQLKLVETRLARNLLLRVLPTSICNRVHVTSGGPWYVCRCTSLPLPRMRKTACTIRFSCFWHFTCLYAVGPKFNG